MKATLLAVALTVLTTTLFAQNLEFGLLGGVSFYNGDIDVELAGAMHNIRPSFGMYSRYFLNERVAVRGQALFAQFKADEKRFPTQTWRGERGYSFLSQVFEVAALPELRVLKIGNLDVYGFGGLGFAFFDAMTDYNSGSEYAQSNSNFIIQEQTAKRQKAAFVIPLGGGIQWAINSTTAIAGEISGRKTFADGFDGIRHSGGTSNDFYFIANLTFSTFIDWNPTKRTFLGMSGQTKQRRHKTACPWF